MPTSPLSAQTALRRLEICMRPPAGNRLKVPRDSRVQFTKYHFYFYVFPTREGARILGVSGDTIQDRPSRSTHRLFGPAEFRREPIEVAHVLAK